MSDSFLVSDGGNGSEVSVEVIVDQITVADENLVSDLGEPVLVEIASTGVGIGSVANLRDLLDVNSSNLQAGQAATNKFVLTYDASSDRFVFSNPDDVLDAAVGINTMSPPQAGLSTSTIDYLDDVLDNKIDLDAGEW
jgi:hypothetical protein